MNLRHFNNDGKIFNNNFFFIKTRLKKYRTYKNIINLPDINSIKNQLQSIIYNSSSVPGT